MSNNYKMILKNDHQSTFELGIENLIIEKSILIDIESKNVRNIKAFFEALILEDFKNEKNSSVELESETRDEISKKVDDEVIELIEDIIDKYNLIIAEENIEEDETLLDEESL